MNSTRTAFAREDASRAGGAFPDRMSCLNSSPLEAIEPTGGGERCALSALAAVHRADPDLHIEAFLEDRVPVEYDAGDEAPRPWCVEVELKPRLGRRVALEESVVLNPEELPALS